MRFWGGMVGVFTGIFIIFCFFLTNNYILTSKSKQNIFCINNWFLRVDKEKERCYKINSKWAVLYKRLETVKSEALEKWWKEKCNEYNELFFSFNTASVSVYRIVNTDWLKSRYGDEWYEYISGECIIKDIANNKVLNIIPDNRLDFEINNKKDELDRLKVIMNMK